jgi:hypothetical protein
LRKERRDKERNSKDNWSRYWLKSTDGFVFEVIHSGRGQRHVDFHQQSIAYLELPIILVSSHTLFTKFQFFSISDRRENTENG